jgi:hypothetical protein
MDRSYCNKSSLSLTTNAYAPQREIENIDPLQYSTAVVSEPQTVQQVLGVRHQRAWLLVHDATLLFSKKRLEYVVRRQYQDRGCSWMEVADQHQQVIRSKKPPCSVSAPRRRPDQKWNGFVELRSDRSALPLLFTVFRSVVLVDDDHDRWPLFSLFSKSILRTRPDLTLPDRIAQFPVNLG